VAAKENIKTIGTSVPPKTIKEKKIVLTMPAPSYVIQCMLQTVSTMPAVNCAYHACYQLPGPATYCFLFIVCC
jgi:hypothetical protein